MGIDLCLENQTSVNLTMTWTKSADGVFEELLVPGSKKCRAGVIKNYSEIAGVLQIPEGESLPVAEWEIKIVNNFIGAPFLRVARPGAWGCKEDFYEGTENVIETGVERFVTKRNSDRNNKQFVVTAQPTQGLRSDLTPCGVPRF